MGKRAFVRGLVLVAVAVTIVPLQSSADPIVGVFSGSGPSAVVRADFGGFHLEARKGFVTGPYIEINDQEGLLIGTTGRGGKDLVIFNAETETVLCQASEFEGGFWLTVDKLAATAKLVSKVPGCVGTIRWTAVGVPGAAGSPYVELGPNLNGGAVGLLAGLKRSATLKGSIAGQSAAGGTGDITYLHWYEEGVGS